jgi:hypothetical protein
MSAKFEVRTEIRKRTVLVRMQGEFHEPDMRAWAVAYREATDRFAGDKHIVIADMRGMKAARPLVAELMGIEIGYARQHGVVLCAHLSDDTVQRLQANRLARQNAGGDDVTIDVASLEEAYELAREARARIDDGAALASIAAADHKSTRSRAQAPVAHRVIR